MNKIRLGDIGTFARGKSKHRPRNDEKLYVGGGYPLVQTGDIKSSSLYVNSHTQEYNDFGLAQSKLWPKGTLAITIAANIAEASILGYQMCFPDSVVGFTADKTKTSEKFVYYLLANLRKRIQSSVSDTGSIQDNINLEFLENLVVSIPELTTQRKIAEVLSALDDKIELNRRESAELEQMARTLYDYWFIQFDFPDADGKPYKTSGGPMKFSPELNRQIPTDWEVTTFSSWIGKTKTGDWGKETPTANYVDKVSCIRGADINSVNYGGELKTPVRFILQKNSGKVLVADDIVVEISGGSPTQSTARIAHLSAGTFERFNNKIICSNFCKAITLKNNSYAFNFRYEWNRLYDAGVFFGFEGKTSGIKNFLFDNFVESYNIVTPPKDIVETFYEFMNSIEMKRQKNLAESQNLASLRDWLLPMLMNGQVSVK